MKVMLDNTIRSHAEFMQHVQRNEVVVWGNSEQTIPIQGMMRKSQDNNPAYQMQKDTLFTVGRLIREDRIQAFEYSEIRFEWWRARKRVAYGNALNGCVIHDCSPALDRTKFRNGSVFDVIKKMGKKDMRREKEINELGQVPFFTWFISLTPEDIKAIISEASYINLTEFEIESFSNLDEYRIICEEAKSPEHYPDAFHLWTTKRNNIEILLSLGSGPIKV